MTNDRITYYWNKYKDEIIAYTNIIMEYNLHSQDMVTDAFIALLKYDDYGESETLALLKGIVKKKRLMIIRHESIKTMHRIYNVATSEYVNSIEIKSEILAIVYKQLKYIPLGRRRIFELNFFHGYRPYEIAKALGISKSTVNSQLKRSIDYLKKVVV